MLAADSEKSDLLIDIIAIGDAMFRHAALCFAALASIVDLCLVSSIERILAQHVVTHRQYLYLYTDSKAISFK